MGGFSSVEGSGTSIDEGRYDGIEVDAAPLLVATDKLDRRKRRRAGGATPTGQRGKLD
jgi:hypothetical protein